LINILGNKYSNVTPNHSSEGAGGAAPIERKKGGGALQLQLGGRRWRTAVQSHLGWWRTVGSSAHCRGTAAHFRGQRRRTADPESGTTVGAIPGGGARRSKSRGARRRGAQGGAGEERQPEGNCFAYQVSEYCDALGAIGSHVVSEFFW